MVEFREACFNDGYELYHVGVTCCGHFDVVPSDGQGV